MNLRNVAGVLLTALLSGAVLAGCGGDRAQDLKTDSRVKVGTIAHLNASEEQYNDIMRSVDETWTSEFSFDYVYYDKLTAMQMGLESDSIQEMSLYKSSAQYLMDRNDKLSLLDYKRMKLSDSFCCAVRKEDKELLEGLNKAIGEMKADGTLEKLTKTYITDLKKGEEPPAVPMPETAGTVLKIAVTGDLPPLDLVLADGKAAGFNTAVLSEIGKRLGRNVEIVQVDSGARAAALSSKKVDVVFWVTLPAKDSKVPADIDKPEGVELTVPYYQDEIVHVGKKK